MRTWTASVLAVMVLALAAPGQAQQPSPPKTGNPTPGTPQPDPPNPADRITVTGCVQLAPSAKALAAASEATPSDARYVLTNAKQESSAPLTYRLEALESLLSPFAGAQVEMVGEVKAGAAGSPPPVLLVEFVRKIASRCP